MWSYTFKRLIQGVLTVWFIATATFFGMHAVPGDPLSAEKAVSETVKENLKAKYGLDQPLGKQYLE
jgi:ABC-type dipeptide/oligopeptide/nickel transport system permease component